MLEKDIEASILYWLNYQMGCYAIKIHTKGTWDQRGFFRKPGKFVAIGCADIVFVYYGLFGCFEVKTPKAYKKFFSSPGEHELRQQSFLQQVKSKGGFAEVVCSLDQVQKHLEELKKKHIALK